MKMTILIGDRENGAFVAPQGSHMLVEVNGKEADLGPVEGVVELLRWYSSQPSPDATMEIHDRLAVAEASAEGLKAALREAQARCESLVKEHAKYREGVIAGDKMVSDKRAELEREIDRLRGELVSRDKEAALLEKQLKEAPWGRIAELEEVVASKDKRIDSLQESVEDLSGQVKTLNEVRGRLWEQVKEKEAEIVGLQEKAAGAQDGDIELAAPFSLEVRKLRLQRDQAYDQLKASKAEARDLAAQVDVLSENLKQREGDIALLKERLKLLETCKEAVEIADRRREIVEACRKRDNALEAFVATPANADRFVAGLELERSIEERIARIERAIPWLGGVK